MSQSPSKGYRLNGSLNESPSEKEGKYERVNSRKRQRQALNESPSEKEGK